MSPSIAFDTTPDFPPIRATTQKTLILSPPSLSSHPEKLNSAFHSYDRNVTDLQMLDRLALGLVSLPSASYDTILILADADETFSESSKVLGRETLAKIVLSLKPGGRLRGLAKNHESFDNLYQTEAILAGLVNDKEGGFQKPDAAQQSVPLQLGRNRKGRGKESKTKSSQPTAPPIIEDRNYGQTGPKPAGVGFVDFSDDFGQEIAPSQDHSDDELIDEDDLLGDDDLGRPIVQPPECRPKAGKRRRACKDCTCGLSKKIENEEAGKRADADKALDSMKLGQDDLAEVDFTVQGKVGSCGSCALGDAFRCDGCPYIGLPAFKPGEEVRLLNNDVQL